MIVFKKWQSHVSPKNCLSRCKARCVTLQIIDGLSRTFGWPCPPPMQYVLFLRIEGLEQLLHLSFTARLLLRPSMLMNLETPAIFLLRFQHVFSHCWYVFVVHLQINQLGARSSTESMTTYLHLFRSRRTQCDHPLVDFRVVVLYISCV